MQKTILFQCLKSAVWKATSVQAIAKICRVDRLAPAWCPSLMYTCTCTLVICQPERTKHVAGLTSMPLCRDRAGWYYKRWEAVVSVCVSVFTRAAL